MWKSSNKLYLWSPNWCFECSLCMDDIFGDEKLWWSTPKTPWWSAHAISNGPSLPFRGRSRDINRGRFVEVVVGPWKMIFKILKVSSSKFLCMSFMFSCFFSNSIVGTWWYMINMMYLLIIILRTYLCSMAASLEMLPSGMLLNISFQWWNRG